MEAYIQNDTASARVAKQLSSLDADQAKLIWRPFYRHCMKHPRFVHLDPSVGFDNLKKSLELYHRTPADGRICLPALLALAINDYTLGNQVDGMLKTRPT